MIIMLALKSDLKTETLWRACWIVLLGLLMLVGIQNRTVNANTTSIQTIPLINTSGNNISNSANNAVQEAEANLQNAINSAGNSNNDVVKHSNYDDETDDEKAGENIENAVLAGDSKNPFQNHGKVYTKANISQVFALEHNLGNDFLNVLIYGGQWLVAIAFVIGCIQLLFGIFTPMNRWGGIVTMGVSLVVFILITHVGSIFSWWQTYIMHSI